MMKRGSFIFDGVDSLTIPALIQSRPLIEAPLRKVEWVSPQGVDGDLPFDEGAYGNTELELIMLTNGDDAIADRQTLYDLIDSKGHYKELIPYFDPDKIYRVMLNNKVQIENQFHYDEAQSISAKFTVKPYKYLVNSPEVIVNGKTKSLTNPTKYTSQPIIKIVGTGAAVLTVNGKAFNIREIPNHITLNSERYLAYQEDAVGVVTNMNNKVTSKEYPVFRPGANSISITGNVTQMIIQPRWRSLL